MIQSVYYPIPKPGVVWKIVDGEAVLVLPAKGVVKVLNEVGARIWSLADGTHTIHDISVLISAEYAVDQGQAEIDTLDFINQLENKGILTLSNQPSQRMGE
jgi:hypothetical protein